MSQLTADPESAGMMKDALVDLKDNRAYQLILEQMGVLMAAHIRELERVDDHTELFRLQGQVQARKRDIAMIQELVCRLDGEMGGVVPPESE